MVLAQSIRMMLQVFDVKKEEEEESKGSTPFQFTNGTCESSSFHSRILGPRDRRPKPKVVNHHHSQSNKTDGKGNEVRGGKKKPWPNRLVTTSRELKKKKKV